MFSWKHYWKSQPQEVSLFSLHKCWVDQGPREACSRPSGAGARTSPALEPEQMALEKELCCVRLTEASSVPPGPHNVSGASWSWACGGRGPFSLRCSCFPPLLWSSGPTPQGPGGLHRVSLLWWELMTHLCREAFPSVCLERDVPHTEWNSLFAKARAIRGLISKSVFRGWGSGCGGNSWPRLPPSAAQESRRQFALLRPLFMKWALERSWILRLPWRNEFGSEESWEFEMHVLIMPNN